LGNQIDGGAAIDFRVSHTASPIATGGIWWANPPKQCTKPPKLKYESCILMEFLLIFTMSRHQQGNKKLTLSTTSDDFHPKLTL